MVLGVLFSFLASVCFNLSNLMEKRGVDSLTKISVRHIGRMLRLLCSSRLWISGFGIGLVAVGLVVIGYSLVPIAVAQSIFGAGTVLIVLAARLYLHEPLARREYIGLALMVISVILVSVTLNSSVSLGVGGSSTSVIFVSSATVLVAGLIFWALRRMLMESGVLFGLVSGLIYGVAALQAKSAAVLLQHRGVLEGIQRAFTSPYPYVFVVASVLGLFTFQMGLQRSRLAVIVPITNIVASVYVVAAGMIVFGESLPRDAILAALRIVGFALVLVASSVFVMATTATATRVRVDNNEHETGSESQAPRARSSAPPRLQTS